MAEPRKCKHCGCTEDRACCVARPDGTSELCRWANLTYDVCSACISIEIEQGDFTDPFLMYARGVIDGGNTERENLHQQRREQLWRDVMVKLARDNNRVVVAADVDLADQILNAYDMRFEFATGCQIEDDDLPY